MKRQVTAKIYFKKEIVFERSKSNMDYPSNYNQYKWVKHPYYGQKFLDLI